MIRFQITMPDPNSSPDFQSRHLWDFAIGSGDEGVRLSLDEYLVQQRESNRHKWRTVRAWERLSRWYLCAPIKLYFPEDIQQQAREEALRLVKESLQQEIRT